MGAVVGPNDVCSSPEPEPDPGSSSPEDYGDAEDFAGACYLDGIETPCSLALGYVNNGAGVIAPLQTTRYNYDTRQFEFFRAYGNGTQGWAGFNYVPGGGLRVYAADGTLLSEIGNGPDSSFEAIYPFETAYVNVVSGDLIGSVIQKKSPCPPVPEAPSRANIDANIKEAERRYRDAASPKWYDLSSGSPMSGPAGRVYTHGVWFNNQVKAGGPWDYKLDDKAAVAAGRDSKYEAFGNFHYGAVGLAAGFDRKSLEMMAGLVQTTGSPDIGGENPGRLGSLLGIGGKPPYGDQYKDNAQIRVGFEYYTRKFVLKDCE